MNAILHEKNCKVWVAFSFSLVYNLRISFFVVFLENNLTFRFKEANMSLTPSYLANWNGRSCFTTYKASNWRNTSASNSGRLLPNQQDQLSKRSWPVSLVFLLVQIPKCLFRFSVSYLLSPGYIWPFFISKITYHPHWVQETHNALTQLKSIFFGVLEAYHLQAA